MSNAESPRVTILMSARERFSATREVLGAVYAQTAQPFRLVYIDGGSPRPIRHYLDAVADEKGFDLVRFPHYLWPNRARNLALSRADTEYVVFLDNDTLVAPNWLEPLIRCADETGADVVTPVVCQYRPVHTEIHFAGGEAGICVEERDGRRERKIYDRIHHQGKPLEGVRPELRRAPTEVCEFHCVLVRRSVFERIGPLDESLLSTREHVDLCMSVRNAGGMVYIEPDSVVTYLGAAPLRLSDIPFYMLRWSDAWALASVKHLEVKWGLSGGDYRRRCLEHIAWRRTRFTAKPWARRFSALLGGRGGLALEGILVGFDRWLNRQLSTRYAHRVQLPAETAAPTELPDELALNAALTADCAPDSAPATRRDEPRELVAR